jgi:hypothetical protein
MGRLKDLNMQLFSQDNSETNKANLLQVLSELVEETVKKTWVS